MKKLLCMLVAGVMVLSMFGCKASDEAKEDVKEAETVATAEPEVKEAVVPGLYKQQYTEEFDGENVEVTYYVWLKEDNTGYMIIQDVIPCTYDESNLYGNYDGSADPYVLDGDTLTVSFDGIDSVFTRTDEELPDDIKSWIEEADNRPDTVAKTIAPLPMEPIDPNNVYDGIFWADLQMDTYQECQDSYGVICELYFDEVYDAVDMTTMSEGDTLVVSGEEMVVTAVEEKNGVVFVNGGIEEGGAEFKANEQGGTFRYFGFDDYPTYADMGEANIYVSPDCVITDNSDLDNPDGTVLTPKEFKDYGKDMTLNHLNTSVRVEDGSIVEINIRYIP